MINLEDLKAEACLNITKVLDYLNVDYEDLDSGIYASCPIHGGDNTRGFSFSRKKQSWRCWTGSCNEEHEKDILGLVQGILENRGDCKGFGPSVGVLCRILNFSGQGERKKRTQSIDENLREIITLSTAEILPDQSCIIDQLDYECPSKYYISRGFHEETLNHFQSGDYYGQGKMAHRALTPVNNRDGELVAYCGRSIHEYMIPKFIFSDGFKKTNFVYNQDKAQEYAEHFQTVFLTEGHGDVWKLYECGVKNAVAIFGKSISQSQIHIFLSMGVSHIVVLTDNDPAGRESKVELKRKLSRYFTLIFPKMKRKDLGCFPNDKIKETILDKLAGHYK